MLARTFTYKDYNGNTQKETWYFSLDKAELLKMELGAWGGLDALMRRLMREEKPGEIVDMFEKIILGAVGEKSPDGRKFIKNEQIREDFRATPAYSELFYELVMDGEKANAFLKGCMPEDISQAIEAHEKQQAAQKAEDDKAAEENEARLKLVTEGSVK